MEIDITIVKFSYKMIPHIKAKVGIEPALTALQAAALPLCHLAIYERETGLKPATSTLARLRSIN